MRSAVWEYTDFRLDIPNPQVWADQISGNGACTTAAVTAYWWQSMQRWILPQLQSRLDEGWEPVTEVGPGGFDARYFRPFFSPTAKGLSGVFDRVLTLVLLPWTLLPWLIGDSDQYMMPTSFTVGLRRRV